LRTWKPVDLDIYDSVMGLELGVGSPETEQAILERRRLTLDELVSPSKQKSHERKILTKAR
jgi:hypothetical protein